MSEERGIGVGWWRVETLLDYFAAILNLVARPMIMWFLIYNNPSKELENSKHCEDVAVSVYCKHQPRCEGQGRTGSVYCVNVSCHHIEVHNKMAPLYNG